MIVKYWIRSCVSLQDSVERIEQYRRELIAEKLRLQKQGELVVNASPNTSRKLARYYPIIL